MKILIIAPRFVANIGEYYDFPLGLAYISSILKKEGYDVLTLNLNHVHQDEVVEAIRSRIDDNGIDAVCCGGLSAHYQAIKDVTDAIRGAERDVKIVLGGGIITSEPEIMLKALDGDAAVIGEGEVTSVDLFDALDKGRDLAEVLGIVYRDAVGKIHITEKRPYIDNLDDVPRPDYEGFEADKYLDMQQPGDSFYLNKFDNPRLLPMILSRSCPFNCTFCYHPLGSKYRRRSLDKFFEDLDYLVENYNINMLAVLDELFSLDKDVMKVFCERMKQYNLQWIAQLRVDQVDRETLSMLKDTGLFYISYGIESASNAILKSMRKHITIEQIEKALEITRDLGIGIQGNFIMGDPAETMETATETIEWWKKHYHYHINITALIPYPGSVVYDYSIEQGLIKDKLEYIEDGCPSLNMTQLDTKTYNAMFHMVRKAQFENQQPCLDVVTREGRFDPVKKVQLSTLEMTCPHCDERNVYNDFFHSKLESFKLVCRNCNQRSDMIAAPLPALLKTWKPLLDQLHGLAESREPISLTPAGNDYLFLETMQSLGFEWRDLNTQYTLDYDKGKEGETFLELPILHRSRENLQGPCADHHIMLLPCERPRAILKELHENGVPLDKIVYLGFNRGLSGLEKPYSAQDIYEEIQSSEKE